jgi:hypothetical protein
VNLNAAWQIDDNCLRQPVCLSPEALARAQSGNDRLFSIVY